MPTFRTLTDSKLMPRNGQTVEVLGPVDPTSYDFEDVGPMVRVRFPDGAETEAFGDEIQPTAGVAEPACTCSDPELAGGNLADGSHWIACPVHDSHDD